MVAFVVYDPTEFSPNGEYTVTSYGDCAPEDVSLQGGSLTAMPVPPASLENFQFAAGILENPPVTGGSWYARMWVDPATGQIGFVMGSATNSEVEMLQRRDQELSDSDWTQLADAPLTTAKKAQWTTYRQALRDLTAQPGWPTSVTWPTPPT